MKPLAQNTLIQNRYLVVHLIGKGGMGEVYLAVDQRLGSAVALKRTYFAGDEMLGNAFEREARTLARMRHPVLPKVSDHFGENEEQYLVMEHIAGDDISKRLEAAQKPFPVSWVMFWADQLLDALSYLHSNEPPIIHRDIKPQNLKLTDENHIILLDFGLSKTSTGQTHISATGSSGSVVGYTPHYAPMEQIRGIGTNARSDLYSLSATLYQLVTNIVPADALTRADVMLNGSPDPIEPPHKLNPEVPPSVSEVILKGMEVSQDKRFGAAREMQKALRRAFTNMQEAMAAQTVAFNLGDVVPPDESLASAIEKTRLFSSEPAPPAVNSDGGREEAADSSDLDFDATIAFDPAENLEQAKQAGSNTEFFEPPVETNGEIVVPTASFPPPQEEKEEVHDSFVTVLAGSRTSGDAPAVNVDAAGIERSGHPELAAPVKKSGGRAFAVLGGVAAFLVLATGAAAAGWYFFNNYYAESVVAEPTPLPEPSPAEEPTPAEPSESLVESNTSVEENSNVASDAIVESEPESERTEQPTRPPSRGDTVSPRQNPASARATNRSVSPPPAANATRKPKANPGRTDILQ
jgi:serine/threonine protein kinase